MSTLFPDLPDPAPPQPFSIAAVSPLFLSYYALGVLAILPNTFFLRVSLLPFIVWQARESIGLDISPWLGQKLGIETRDGLVFWHFAFVGTVFIMAVRSFEWAFIRKPLRKYEPLEDQSTPVERPLTISNVLLDGCDLFFNQRGLAWSWSPNPFPRESAPPLSILSVTAKVLVKFTVLDASQYLIQYMCPSVNKPGGGSIFEPSYSPWSRVGVAAFAGVCGGFWVWAILDSYYEISALVGRTLLRQPASQWPPLSHRPWLSTSLHAFWSFRWHQLFRHFFVTFGARPGGAILGQSGAFFGAFTASAIMHHVGLWGLNYGTLSTARFFLLMGIGIIIERVFKKATGLRVGGIFGWLWSILWVLVWGVFLLDEWAQRGMVSTVFLPARFRYGKLAVETVITLSKKLMTPQF
ncbi:hypothetical protein B0F90DRAFT_1824932 [Multifurca ochricompacta]|uniref:Wax synthase domain-containing protein n=1 Tax=Multifurca ochricompacta TaxID=376703 RepID=A0AAD4QH57_9AGAM|nr:hypothetical protein B0F90DRAFT_1824932 [Multifurca ochricompacta]